jgi:hypothetical protein
LKESDEESMESNNQVARRRPSIEIDGPSKVRAVELHRQINIGQREDRVMKAARIHGRNDNDRRNLVRHNRCAAVPFQLLTTGGMWIALGRIALMRYFASVAAGATTLAEIATCAAGTTRLAMLFATILDVHAATAMARGLEATEAATSDNRPAIENSQRYGSPY